MQRTNIWTPRGERDGGVGRGGHELGDWEIGIDMYTLICIKWITNKNLLYKNINKIKFKNSKKNTILGLMATSLHIPSPVLNQK